MKNGWKLSEETRKKIGDARRGKKLSMETKYKVPSIFISNLNDWIRLCVSCHWKFDKVFLLRDRNYQGRFI